MGNKSDGEKTYLSTFFPGFFAASVFCSGYRVHRRTNAKFLGGMSFIATKILREIFSRNCRSIELFPHPSNENFRICQSPKFFETIKQCRILSMLFRFVDPDMDG